MFETLVNTFVTLFIVVDPPGIIPVFLALASCYSRPLRRTIAIRASLVSLGLLLVFAVVGGFILDKLGIGEPAFRIAGGVLLLLVAIEMVFSPSSQSSQIGSDQHKVKDEKDNIEKDNISIFPLSIPMIAGPGGLTAVIILMKRAEGVLILQLGVATMVVLVVGITYLFLRLADPISKVIGEAGSNVLCRVFGIILASLAIQFISNGVLETFGPIVSV